VAVLEPTDQNALVPHQAYVEDDPDSENPPHAPTPPSAIPNNRDSVFDYMVNEDQPNTPKITFSKSKGEMAMKNGAPSVFSDSRSSSRTGYRNNEERVHSQDYQDQGFSYGTEPVNPRPYHDVNPSYASLDFMTPGARATKLRLEGKERPSLGHSRQNSGSEKKRKRGETDPNGRGIDTPMTDVDAQLATVENTPSVVHSGLTGGLNRMMSEDTGAFPLRRSPDHDGDRARDRGRGSRRTEKYEEPASPLKRSRYSKDESGLGISIKGRAVKALSMVGGALLPGVQQDANTSRTRRRASSSSHDQSNSRPREGEKRERKKHKVHRHNGTSSANVRHERHGRGRGSDESPEAQRRKLKAIEYRKPSNSGSDSEDNKRNGASQMVIFGAEEKQRRRCETFLSNIPGTDSEKGYSIHKALKRWHKQNDVKHSSSKTEEEQELWRGLRLRKNDRGEIVISF
jgi:cell growth-regulating nucleolar protein